MSSIETFSRTLPNGTTLSCRAAGQPGRPLMVFVHGFPEAAFIWDALMAHFAQPAHGGFRCVAPNLRGFERSSAPQDPADYRAHLLLQDLRRLVESERPDGHVDTLVAHDWGGALAWGYANVHGGSSGQAGQPGQPGQLGRLVILNSPHAATFARELAHNPAQQAASAYMHWLSRPGAEAKLIENDFARLFGMLETTRERTGGEDWLTEAVKQQYREVWGLGMTGGCNLYRISPLKPPLPGEAAKPVLIPPERVRVDVPTLVIWGEADRALLPSLLDGLDEHVPQLTVQRVPGATHWIVQEQPVLVADLIERFQATTRAA
jgi:pimeloyl-ACP methyl ester carboxylesterase